MSGCDNRVMCDIVGGSAQAINLSNTRVTAMYHVLSNFGEAFRWSVFHLGLL